MALGVLRAFGSKPKTLNLGFSLGFGFGVIRALAIGFPWFRIKPGYAKQPKGSRTSEASRGLCFGSVIAPCVGHSFLRGFGVDRFRVWGARNPSASLAQDVSGPRVEAYSVSLDPHGFWDAFRAALVVEW